MLLIEDGGRKGLLRAEGIKLKFWGNFRVGHPITTRFWGTSLAEKPKDLIL